MRRGSEQNSGSSEVSTGGTPEKNKERRRAKAQGAGAHANSQRGAVQHARRLVRLLHNTVTTRAATYVTGHVPDQEKSTFLGLTNEIFKTAAPHAFQVANAEKLGSVEKNHETCLNDDTLTRAPGGPGIAYMALLCQTNKEEREAVRRLLQKVMRDVEAGTGVDEMSREEKEMLRRWRGRHISQGEHDTF